MVTEVTFPFREKQEFKAVVSMHEGWQAFMQTPELKGKPPEELLETVMKKAPHLVERVEIYKNDKRNDGPKGEPAVQILNYGQVNTTMNYTAGVLSGPLQRVGPLAGSKVMNPAVKSQTPG